MKKNIKIFVFWLILVVVWNFGYPGATPFYDVCIAVLLYFLTPFLHDKL